MTLTIDAGVFVARFREEDAFHANASAFFAECERRKAILLAPVLLLAEVAGALSRIRGESRFGEIATKRLVSLHGLRLRQADIHFAEKAAHIAARHGLRGAGAFYVALAKETRSVLVTTDSETMRSASSSVTMCGLSDWLKGNA